MDGFFPRAQRIIKSEGGRALARKIFRVIADTFWKQEQYLIYLLPTDPAVTKLQASVSFIGINKLFKHDDSERPLHLAELYNGFQAAGDWGLVALCEGQPIGWAWLKQGPYTEPTGCGTVAIDENLQVIRYFEVVPEYRGQGIGQALLAELTRRICATPHKSVVALVAKNNIPSQNCFEKLKYQRGGTIAVRRLLYKAIPTKLANPYR